jgi:hypothetical protein
LQELYKKMNFACQLVEAVDVKYLSGLNNCTT